MICHIVSNISVLMAYHPDILSPDNVTCQQWIDRKKRWLL